MSSDVEICNMALSHLGDSATVASIDPPEGSSQAEHCARWYPVARDSLLEMHDWSFSLSRVVLAPVTNIWPEWRYAYARPSNASKIISVLSIDAQSDFTIGYRSTDWCGFGRGGSQTVVETPQDFTCETDADGQEIIYTNMPNAVARFKRDSVDTSRYSSLFRDTLGWYLASFLAGPVLKGDSGIAAAGKMMQAAMGILAQAKMLDAAQQRQQIDHVAPWLAVR